MQTADVNHEDFLNQNQTKMDEALLVKFFIKAKLSQSATKKEGRPIYRDVEYIDIKIPGDRTGGACRPARPRDIQRFARHYKAFKERVEGDDELIEGTPLSEWASMSRSVVEEMAFFNVKTVEQLAAMSDTHTGKFMGINALKRKAQEWLAAAKQQQEGINLSQELKKRDDKIDEMSDQIKQLLAAAKPKPKKKSAVKSKPPAEIVED